MHAARRCARLIAGLAIAAAGCRPHPAPLTVSAAISLKEALSDVKGAFEAAHPRISVALNFGASGDLARQIEAGAPVDVFASADERTMDRLAARDLIDARTRRDIAANQLVLVV